MARPSERSPDTNTAQVLGDARRSLASKACLWDDLTEFQAAPGQLPFVALVFEQH